MRIGYKAQPGRSTQFRYDGLGRRTATLSNNGAASTETRHLWCGDSLCQSRTAADTVTRRYYPEGELRPQGNTLLYYHRDHLGSVRDVTNLPNAARIAAFDYGPYGTPAQTSGRLSTDFRYAGMFYLQEAGLYLTRHRAYDPDNARWLSRDPIGEAGGINLYGYVGGDPVNWVDPLGLSPASDECKKICDAEGAEVDVCVAARIPNTEYKKVLCHCKKSPSQIGKEGEDAVRSQNDIGDKEHFNVNGRDRISDGSNKTAVSEVKNVQKQSLTQQLRDSIQHAENTDRRFDLYLPKDSPVTKPLQNEINNGAINRLPIP